MIAFAHIEAGTKVAAAQTQWVSDGYLVLGTGKWQSYLSLAGFFHLNRIILLV
jgi:hypothetical protein